MLLEHVVVPFASVTNGCLRNSAKLSGTGFLCIIKTGVDLTSSNGVEKNHLVKSLNRLIELLPLNKNPFTNVVENIPIEFHSSLKQLMAKIDAVARAKHTTPTFWIVAEILKIQKHELSRQLEHAAKLFLVVTGQLVNFVNIIFSTERKFSKI
jgi:hypothetical protein